VLGDRDDVAAGDFGNGDTSIGLVGGVEVNVIRSNTGGDGDLQVLGFGETLCGQVTRVETEKIGRLAHARGLGWMSRFLRSGNDDLGINQVLVKLGVFTLLV
jgi:hypothetical protein